MLAASFRVSIPSSRSSSQRSLQTRRIVTLGRQRIEDSRGQSGCRGAPWSRVLRTAFGEPEDELATDDHPLGGALLNLLVVSQRYAFGVEDNLEHFQVADSILD